MEPGQAFGVAVFMLTAPKFRTEVSAQLREDVDEAFVCEFILLPLRLYFCGSCGCHVDEVECQKSEHVTGACLNT